ncbi:reverse transcriptase domain-containing protein [Tanacetum coccineum]|uniref:Reverse transcriptase domain-containing protein n=1 Tax=Tanacetum coccineum TaxID=301880 RepID=A0ABQ5BYN9_9ASTR
MSNELKNVMTNFLQMQNPSGSGSLPSNTIANPRGDVKAITTRSGVAYDGPTIPPTPSPLPKEVERETEATKDKVQTTSLESTAHVQPPVVQIPIPEPEVAPKPNPKPSIPYPSRLNDQKDSFADALLHMPKFASTFKKLDECLALADLGASINLMPLSVWKKLSLPELTPTRMTLELADRSVAHPKGVAEDVFVKTLLVRSILKKCSDFRIVQQVLIPLFRILSLLLLPPSFTPFKGGDFLLEEIEACLSSDSIPSGIDDADFDPEGDIRLLEKLLNDDISSPLPPKELNFEELKTIKSSIDDPPELELKDL